MNMTSGEIRKAALKAGIPEQELADFIVDVHMRSQYIPPEKAIASCLKIYKRHEVAHPGHILDDSAR